MTSVHNSSGPPNSFELVDPVSGQITPFSSVTGLSGDVNVATVHVSANQGGFNAGDVYASNGVPGQILKISNNSLVNNSFAAPGATGCGGFLVELLLDPIINAKLGLPAAAGNNTAILTGTLEQAGAEPVREH